MTLEQKNDLIERIQYLIVINDYEPLSDLYEALIQAANECGDDEFDRIRLRVMIEGTEPQALTNLVNRLRDISLIMPVQKFWHDVQTELMINTFNDEQYLRPTGFRRLHVRRIIEEALNRNGIADPLRHNITYAAINSFIQADMFPNMDNPFFGEFHQRLTDVVCAWLTFDHLEP